MTTPDPFAPSGDAPQPDDATAELPPPPAGPTPWAPQPPMLPPSPGAAAGAAQPAPVGAPAAAQPAPGSRTQPGLVAGVILVVIGAILLVGRLIELNLDAAAWPLWIVLPGLAMLVGSFFIPPRGGLGLAIPGAIVTIVGLVLWVQETYDVYATWAYAWALVAPTGPGLGMLLYGVVHRDHELVSDGLRLTLIGLGLFVGFALFFEGVIGLSGRPIEHLDEVLPYAAIVIGVLLVVLSFLGRGRRGQPAA